MKPKVFCIGFHKTGTSSLGEALRQLGYKVANYTPQLLPDIQAGNWQPVWDYVAQYDAFQDNPWPIIYQELDQQYPGSKFIMSYRLPERWIQSAVKHFGTNHTNMREWIYGIGHPEGNEDIYVARYEKHIQEVKAYFADRPDDFVILDWAAGDGWEKLCPLLDKPIPKRDFPHTNSARHRSFWGRVQIKMEKILGR